jgi:mannose-6-phosphate isomerase-like protein (cupin superfamily)
MGTDGVMVRAGDGERIAGGGLDATIKVTTSQPAFYSTFEMVMAPGYDVGAHVHEQGEEMFFVLEGEFEMFAFEPADRSVAHWRDWRSADGAAPMRGGPGMYMFIPEGCPHAFANVGDEPGRLFFQSSVPGGHENYFRELAALLAAHGGKPPAEASDAMRRRWHIDQLTPIDGGRVAA